MASDGGHKIGQNEKYLLQRLSTLVHPIRESQMAQLTQGMPRRSRSREGQQDQINQPALQEVSGVLTIHSLTGPLATKGIQL